MLLEASGNSNFCFQNRLILPMRGLFGFKGIKELRILAEEVQETEEADKVKESEKKEDNLEGK
jgi:hypothetical protein